MIFGEQALNDYAVKLRGPNKDDKVFIGMGDFSCQDGLRGNARTPLKKMYHLSQKFPNVTVIFSYIII